MTRKKSTKDLISERPSPEQLKKLPRTPITIIADNIRSLDNVGLLFRLCELARIEKLYLTGYTGYPRTKNDKRSEYIIERHDHRITKTAVYAVPYQPWEYVQDAQPLVKTLKEKGNTILALEQTSTSIPYHHLEATKETLPITLIIGHERQGVSENLLTAADTIIDIPILGIGNSHNVALATGIVLYHLLEITQQI